MLTKDRGIPPLSSEPTTISVTVIRNLNAPVISCPELPSSIDQDSSENKRVHKFQAEDRDSSVSSKLLFDKAHKLCLA